MRKAVPIFLLLFTALAIVFSGIRITGTQAFAEDEVAQLKAQLKALQADMMAVIEQGMVAKNNLAKASDRIKELEKQNSELESKLKESTESKTALQSQLQEATTQITLLDSKLKVKDSSSTIQADEVISKLKKENNDLRYENSVLKAKLAKKK